MCGPQRAAVVAAYAIASMRLPSSLDRLVVGSFTNVVDLYAHSLEYCAMGSGEGCGNGKKVDLRGAGRKRAVESREAPIGRSIGPHNGPSQCRHVT
ncbi:hypothetical protein GW17_00003022 [Ensete ventricosum]|nr:hypothetical protein GW17_00003022 [Ensete ventricosum]